VPLLSLQLFPENYYFIKRRAKTVKASLREAFTVRFCVLLLGSQ
jgi:hypothetical protein